MRKVGGSCISKAPMVHSQPGVVLRVWCVTDLHSIPAPPGFHLCCAVVMGQFLYSVLGL